MKYLTVLFSFTFLLIFSSQAQTIEGDGLFDMLGTKIDAPITKQFFNSYGIKNLIRGVYASSGTGIRVAAQHDTIITTIQLYLGNQFCGTYKNKLPKGIKFDMSQDEVTKKLGKPNYTSADFCVYRTTMLEMTYWFMKDGLYQVEFSLKEQK